MTDAPGAPVADDVPPLTGATPPLACDACLRRSWLVARLAGRIEIARHEGRRLREVLALSPEALLAAVGGAEAAPIGEALAVEDLPDRLRSACATTQQLPVCRHADAYPPRLHDLQDRPAVIYLLGSTGEEVALRRLADLAGGPLDDGARAVAVVGTRRASPDGLEQARALGRGLSAAGVTAVSGMALGIDAAVHGGALERGGRTIAVLGCGADVVYPRRKRALHATIARDGLVVSELPPGVEPRRWTFPARNRLIAALAQMTVVVEAAGRSGSLITAECAADLGREVGAMPGPVLSWRSEGTNSLLRDGATLVRHAADVLDAVVGLDRPPPAPLDLPERLRIALRAVAGGADSVAAVAGAPDRAQAAMRDLSELELLGLVKRVPGGRWIAVPR